MVDPISYARMLGLTNQSAPFDDEVIINTSYNWSYGQDVIDTVEHELSEGGMGRIGGLGDQNSAWSTMDLFRFNAAGAPTTRMAAMATRRSFLQRGRHAVIERGPVIQ